MELNGMIYTQSMAKARYAGRLTGLCPTDPLEALKVDMILETLSDGLNKFVEVNWKTSKEVRKAQKIKDFAEVGLPKIFGLIEKNISGEFLLGDKVSMADVYILDMYNNSFKTLFSDFKAMPYPKVEAIIASITANAVLPPTSRRTSEWYRLLSTSS